MFENSNPVRGLLGALAVVGLVYGAGVGEAGAKPPKKGAAKITSVVSAETAIPHAVVTGHLVHVDGQKLNTLNAKGRALFLGCSGTAPNTWKKATVTTWNDTRIRARLPGAAGYPRPCRFVVAVGEQRSAGVHIVAKLSVALFRNDEADADGDGHASQAWNGDDCDDYDSLRHPGNAEVADFVGHDEDCNPETFGTLDKDGDGFTDSRVYNTRSDGTVKRGRDCNDNDMSVHPGQVEACNRRDDNCNGQIDEGLLNCPS